MKTQRTDGGARVAQRLARCAPHLCETKSGVHFVFHVCRVITVDLSCVSKVFLWVFRFSSISTINAYKTTQGHYLGDLKTRKSTGNSCQIEIHFSSQTSKFLMKYNLPRFQISGELIIFFTKHDYKVSTSFIKEDERYKRLKTAKWIFIR